MYQFDRRDATVFLATSRLFGWRARTTLFGFFSRDRERDDTGEEILLIQDRKGVSLTSAGGCGAFRLSTVTGTSAAAL